MTDFLRRYRSQGSVFAALVAPFAVALALVPFRSTFASSAAALTMVVVISAVAIPGTRLSGVLASVSSGLWFDLFLTPPYGHISIARRPDIETTISILIVGVIITELALRSRIHRRASNETVGFLIKIHEVTELASSSAPVAVVIDETRKSLIEILGLRSCRFERGRSDPPLARIESNGQVMHVGMRWPVDDVGIPGPEAEIVAQWRGRSLGRFVLVPSPGRPVSLERRVVAVSLVDVAAAYVAAEDRGR